MRLKIHRNEALESMARETVMTEMKHTSVIACMVYYAQEIETL